MTKISGSCLCGQVSYEGETEIANVITCHCTDCQKASGSAYMTNVFVKEADLTLSGEVMEFEHKADSGSDMTKVNCAKCGSPILGRNSARPGLAVLRAGCLDQKELIEPKLTVFRDSKIPSTPDYHGIPVFGRMPH